MSTPLQQRIKSFQCEIHPLDLSAWLSSRGESPKFFFSSRDGQMTVASVGSVDRLQGSSLNDLPEVLRLMQERLKESTFQYFGGVAFNDRCCAGEWSGFGAYDFVLPKVQITQSENQTTLTIFSIDQEISAQEIEQWTSSLNVSSLKNVSYQLLSVRKDPGFETWEKTFERIFEDFDRQVFQKIVMARRVECVLDQQINPWLILNRLQKNSVNSYAFAWMPAADRAFVGATPERLFKRSGCKIDSEAVAGTKPRGMDDREDLSIEKDLLSSLKNESEHRFVVDYILKSFRQLCREYSYDKTIQLLKLTDNQHLLTKFQGWLKDDVTDADVIRVLHPTPAVGGFSRESAVGKILSYETINRGWFTGLIGCVGVEETEFAVAIRSGLIRGNTVDLYAGAGIVEGSEPQDEWDEIDGKMKGWMKVLQE